MRTKLDSGDCSSSSFVEIF